jgi:C1A family cysteine protease
MELSAPTVLPSSIFMDPWLGPVKNQGSEGSCTAQTGAGDAEFELRKYDPRYKDNPASAPVLSAQFLYWMERFLEGSLAVGDAGSHGRTSCQALNKFGICTEASFPYVPGQFNIIPTDVQKAEALQFKLGAYHSLQTVDDMKRCLASGYCFRVGFIVTESFETKTGGTTVYQPQHGESVLGGHEVLVKGFDDAAFGGAFSARNSWGPGWGRNGDFWLPYTIAADRKILLDAWLQHRGPVWKV